MYLCIYIPYVYMYLYIGTYVCIYIFTSLCPSASQIKMDTYFKKLKEKSEEQASHFHELCTCRLNQPLSKNRKSNYTNNEHVHVQTLSISLLPKQFSVTTI